MSEDFDPYRKWMGIPPEEQPPNHYRLLGIPLFEHDPDVIDNAADRQMAHVRTYQTGKYSRLSQQILNELSAAKVCLLVPDKKQAYDEQLRAALQQEISASAPASAPAAPPPPRSVATPPPTSVVPVRAAAVAVEPKPAAGSGIPVVSPRRSLGRVSSITSRARSRRKSSMMPIMMGVIGVAVLIGVVVLAVNMASNQQADTANPNPADQIPSSFVPSPVPKTDTNKSPVIRPGTSGGKLQPGTGTTDTPPKFPEVGGLNPPSAQPSQTEQFQQAMRLARQALSRRDLDAAKTQLVEAELAQSSQEQKAEIERVRAVRLYMDGFWKAVHDGIKKLEMAPEFEFQGDKFELVKCEGELVTYKFKGEEKESRIRSLPAAHAVAFARQSLPDDDAFTYLYVAAFVAFDADGDAVKRLDEAKKLWQQAANMGQTNKYLAQEFGLDDIGSTSVTPNVGDPAPRPPLKPETPQPEVAKPESPPALQPPSQPQRTPVPDARALARARASLRITYAHDLQAARSSDTRIALSDMLVAKAAGEQDLDLQFVTWEEARDLAVAAGKPQSLLDIIDQMAEKFDVDALTEKQTYLAKFNAEPDADSSELLKLAEDLCKLAEQQQRYDIAAGFADTASRAARKANNFTAVQTYADEMKRLKALAAEKPKAP
jgi:hypothetical protein